MLKRIIHSFECENMPLTERDIENVKQLLSSAKTADELIEEETIQMIKEGLINNNSNQSH